jgi:lipid-A-disaccharide synthase-like uncharacterized protein
VLLLHHHLLVLQCLDSLLEVCDLTKKLLVKYLDINKLLVTYYNQLIVCYANALLRKRLIVQWMNIVDSEVC